MGKILEILAGLRSPVRAGMLASPIMMVLAGGFPANAAAEYQLHVAPGDGHAVGDGSARAPFTTPVQARDAIRKLRREGKISGEAAVTVNIGPGNYPMDSTFELTGEDGGSATAPVVYRATRPGTARLIGGMMLEPRTFKPVEDPAVSGRLDPAVRDQVRVGSVAGIGQIAPLKPAYRGVPDGPWLYFDGRPMTLARWPNESAPDGGWAKFTKAIDKGLPQPGAGDPSLRVAHGGAFEFADPRVARWRIDDGVWLWGYWTHDWYDEVIRVAGYDEAAKVIRLAAPHQYGINAGTWGAAGRRFFAQNVMEELDAPGEWYLDRPRQLLYFLPPGPLSGATVVLGTLAGPVLHVRHARHLRLEGLRMEYGHGAGILLDGTEHVAINGCVVANCAGDGISVNGSRNTVRSCDLFHLGKSGVRLAGGDRKKLEPAGNLAVNNHIHHYGRFQRTYAPGIHADGCGQIARNNRIHDAPHNAVLYGGNEHVFENNEIYRVVMETGDAGAFYTGRDWTSRGNVLRHNYIHDLGGGDASHVNTMGVYLDDCDCGDTIEGNIFQRAGRAIMIGGGRDNPVRDNLVLDCPIGLHIDTRGMTWKQWNNPEDPSWALEDKAKKLDYTNPPWSTRYPRLAAIMAENPREPANNPITGNVFVDCPKVVDFDAKFRGLAGKEKISGNLIVTRKPMAAKAAANDHEGFTRVSGGEAEAMDIDCTIGADGRLVVRGMHHVKKSLPGFALPEDPVGLVKDAWRTEVPPR